MRAGERLQMGELLQEGEIASDLGPEWLWVWWMWSRVEKAVRSRCWIGASIGGM